MKEYYYTDKLELEDLKLEKQKLDNQIIALNQKIDELQKEIVELNSTIENLNKEVEKWHLKSLKKEKSNSLKNAKS